jgi:hypothetical protein
MRALRLIPLITFASLAAIALPAQKIDSLMIKLPFPKERAAEAVVHAFTTVGLGVSNTTSWLIEADQGATPNNLVGGQARRVVRAVLLPSDSSTVVIITGIEERSDQHGTSWQRLRIDNHAGGNGGKVWEKMVGAALLLDSTAVPAAARTR